MRISWRPKSRASREKAPEPVHSRAAAITIANRAELACEEVEVGIERPGEYAAQAHQSDKNSAKPGKIADQKQHTANHCHQSDESPQWSRMNAVLGHFETVSIAIGSWRARTQISDERSYSQSAATFLMKVLPFPTSSGCVSSTCRIPFSFRVAGNLVQILSEVLAFFGSFLLTRDGWRHQTFGSMRNLEVHHITFRSNSGETLSRT